MRACRGAIPFEHVAIAPNYNLERWHKPAATQQITESGRRLTQTPYPSEPSIDAVALRLREGGVIAHATEGVWGFACDPHSPAAVARVMAIKGRSAAKGLLLIADQADAFADQLAGQDPDLAAAARASWPGAHTWILPNTVYSSQITGARDTVGCRVPGHAQARSLCAAFGGALVSTSANRAGETALVDYHAVCAAFADLVDAVLPGQVNVPGQPSTIHALDGSILR